MKYNKFISGIMTLLIVTSMLIMPAQTVSAASTSNPDFCLDSNKLSDGTIQAVKGSWQTSWGSIAGSDYDKGTKNIKRGGENITVAFACNTGINTTSTDANQVEIDIYSSMSSMKKSSERTRTTFDNSQQYYQSIALARGKKAFFTALNNGDTKSVALSKANQTIEDYYSIKQYNYIQHWNLLITEASSYASRASNETNISSQYVGGNYTGTDNQYNSYNEEYIRNTTVYHTTLINGTETDVVAVKITTTKNDQTKLKWADPITVPKPEEHGISTNGTGSENPSAYFWRIETRGYSNDVSPVFIDGREIGKRENWLKSNATQAKEKMATISDGLYDGYTSGDITAEDYTSALNINSDYSPTDNFDAWALSQYAKFGVSTPQTLNSTGYMLVSDKKTGEEYKGIVISDETPNGSLETGVVYNSSNLTGMQAVVTNDSIHRFEGEFEITKMKTKEGETKTSTTYENVDYETENVTETREQLELLEQKRAEIEAYEKALASTGSTSSTNPQLPNWLTRKYFGIPIWGFAVFALIGAYLLNAARGRR